MTLPPVPRREVFEMIVLLAAGIGVSVLGLLAIGFGIPISDSSFGNALLIAGVVILCTGLILIGMWLAARELISAAKLGAAIRPAAVPRAAPASPFAAAIGNPAAERPAADAAASPRSGEPASPPPWADEVAARTRPRGSAAEAPAVEPEPPSSAAPDRPARRNLLFAAKRRDKDEPLVALPTALEAEPKVSFENAWPNPSRQNGSADRSEPVPPDANGAEANGALPAGQGDATAQTAAPNSDLPPGVTVLRSGSVDGMAYTLYSDGSIEAQFAGESPIRFASFAALKAHVEQQQRQ
jgi:hypothetical protein